MRRMLFFCLLCLTLASAGCRGQDAVPGQVEITSTEAFKNLKGSKSPPPKTPTRR